MNSNPTEWTGVYLLSEVKTVAKKKCVDQRRSLSQVVNELLDDWAEAGVYRRPQVQQNQPSCKTEE